MPQNCRDDSILLVELSMCSSRGGAYQVFDDYGREVILELANSWFAVLPRLSIDRQPVALGISATRTRARSRWQMLVDRLWGGGSKHG